MGDYCYCGRLLVVRFGIKMCPKHGSEIKKPAERPKRPDFSGKSKTPFGLYEER